MAEVILDIVEQHAGEAAFLWLLRDAAVRAPHYNLDDLAALDDRVEAHIDGLRIAEESGWDVAVELALEEPGEVFAAGVLALEGKDPSRLDQVLDAAVRSDDCFRGMASAIGWVPPDCSHWWLDRWRSTTTPSTQRLRITGHSILRQGSCLDLDSLGRNADRETLARFFRAAGELKRRNWFNILAKHFSDDDVLTRFWASWSAALMDYRAVNYLEPFADDATNDFHQPAVQLVFRAMDPRKAREKLMSLAKSERDLRTALIGMGVFGDPQFIQFLLEQAENPEVARVAGESFTMITGVDLTDQNFVQDPPEDFDAVPNDDTEDENVALDPDEDIPWPDPTRIQEWWESNGGRFTVGTRFLCGRPVDKTTCLEVLQSGVQRQRRAAALELALLRPEEPLFNTSAPGFRQQERLLVRKG